MEFKQWLLEMPIVNLQRLGDWEPEKPKKPRPGQPAVDPGAKPSAYDSRRSAKKGYYKDDFGILTSDAAVEKIKRRWSKCEEPFNTFFLRSKEGARQREVGLVDLSFLTDKLKLKPEAVDQINNPSAINIIYTNNMGGERMPMNWWTMAHRVGHAIKAMPGFDLFTRNVKMGFNEVLRSVFQYEQRNSPYPSYGRNGTSNDQMILGLASSVCTFASARNRKIRNIFELYYELLAQYIIQGGVKFNPLSRNFISGFVYGRPQHVHADRYLDADELEGWNEYLTDHLAPEIDSYIGSVLDKCIGKIFVM